MSSDHPSSSVRNLPLLLLVASSEMTRLWGRMPLVCWVHWCCRCLSVAAKSKVHMEISHWNKNDDKMIGLRKVFAEIFFVQQNKKFWPETKDTERDRSTRIWEWASEKHWLVYCFGLGFPFQTWKGNSLFLSWETRVWVLTRTEQKDRKWCPRRIWLILLQAKDPKRKGNVALEKDQICFDGV